MIRNIACVWSRLAAMGLLLLPAGILAAPASSKLPVVPKWQRFEQSFRSSFVYSNALQDAAFRVAFVSPMGETNEVDGFWDGGRTWRKLGIRLNGKQDLVAMVGAIVLTLHHRARVRRQDIGEQVARTPAASIEIVKVRSGQGLGSNT